LGVCDFLVGFIQKLVPTGDIARGKTAGRFDLVPSPLRLSQDTFSVDDQGRESIGGQGH
jgi:hypothetical protein